MTPLDFEYDPSKSESNLAKHGIDFERAKALWLSLVVEVDAKTVGGEGRKAAIGLIDGKAWTVIYTMRGQARRIISARRSRAEERRLYDSAIGR